MLVLTAGLFAWSVLAGQSPLLGLDLQGGVEVVLEPVDTPENLALATPENLDLAVEILRQRVDAIGVAEPDITTQTGGDTNFIIVQLPGIEDQDAAVELVGTTAQLQFRPVLFDANLRAGVEQPPGGDFPDEVLNGGPGLEDLFDGVVSDPNNTAIDESAIFRYASTTTDGTSTSLPVLVGPTQFTGTTLSGAEALFINGQWLVEVTFKAGEEGLDQFNQAAAICFEADLRCPSSRLAFVLDGVIESAPSIEAPFFERREVSITRPNGFAENEAKNSALILDFGALPLAFDDPADPEAGLVRSVSASLGRDSLNAGLVAGIVGIAVVALYMLWYYRLLGLVALLSLTVSATLLWTVVSYLSASRGLALTLAGVVGLIVSIGVSLDSNVVFFEDLKEVIRRGDGLGAAVDKAFPKAFGTVFWANLATLIGALILYVLTIGSVRGFALMLAIASILDLVATWFFMAPLVRLLANKFGDRPSLFGVRSRTTSELSNEGASA